MNKQTLEKLLQDASVTLQDIRQHICDVYTALRKNDSQDELGIAEFCRFAYNLLDVELQRAQISDDSNESSAGTAGIDSAVNAFFTSSMAGPLFTSSKIQRTNSNALPSYIHATTILPLAPAHFRALGDLQIATSNSSRPSILQARKQPLITGKQVSLGNFESFGPLYDHNDAMLSIEGKSLHHYVRQEIKSESDHKQSEVPKPDTTTSATPANIDIALLEDFAQILEPDDISASIAKLSEMQESRMRKSPLTAVPDDEQALATEIKTRLQSQILTSNIKPKDLITGIRKDYTFLKYAPSYIGTLPPTVSQMVPATRIQVLPTTTTRPLYNNNNNRPVEKPVYAPTKHVSRLG